jgi:hypothetical protein
MASTKIKLSEKGFGEPGKGCATILADANGQPLTMKLVALPNGMTGGQVLLIPLKSIVSRYMRTFVNTSEEVFEIKVEHKQNVGTVTVRHFECEELNFDTYQAGIVVESARVRILSSHGMPNSDKAKEILNGFLFKAFEAAIDRAFTPNPDRMFYGKLAMDGGFTKLEYFEKNKTIEA